MCFITPDIVERIRAEMNREYDVSELEAKLETVKKNQKVLLARKKKLEQARDALDPLDRNFDMKSNSSMTEIEHDLETMYGDDYYLMEKAIDTRS